MSRCTQNFFPASLRHSHSFHFSAPLPTSHSLFHSRLTSPRPPHPVPPHFATFHSARSHHPPSRLPPLLPLPTCLAWLWNRTSHLHSTISLSIAFTKSRPHRWNQQGRFHTEAGARFCIWALWQTARPLALANLLKYNSNVRRFN